jgi:hypothetical protein
LNLLIYKAIAEVREEVTQGIFPAELTDWGEGEGAKSYEGENA